MIPLFQVKRLAKDFQICRRKVSHAVKDASFEILKGETLGLVGHSGCGKTTLGRCLLGLEHPTRGEVLFEGKNLLNLQSFEIIQFRRQAQMIFQNAYASLNPKLTMDAIISEPFRIHRIYREKEERKQIEMLLDLVGLSRNDLNKYPHQFSGGQRQRIVIARALALKPKILICDEPLSSLDVSIQAQIVNLLRELQKEFALTYLFISHDLAMVKYVSDRIIVMHQGEVVETASSEELWHNPQHAYTKKLLAAIP